MEWRVGGGVEGGVEGGVWGGEVGSGVGGFTAINYAELLNFHNNLCFPCTLRKVC